MASPSLFYSTVAISVDATVSSYLEPAPQAPNFEPHAFKSVLPRPSSTCQFIGARTVISDSFRSGEFMGILRLKMSRDVSLFAAPE